MRAIRILPLLLLLACPLALAYSYTRESLAVDSALDSGASWNYLAGQADFTRSHAFIPYARRHGLFITVSVISLCAALLYAALLRTVLRIPRRRLTIHP